MSKHGEIIDGIVDRAFQDLRDLEFERRMSELDKRIGYKPYHKTSIQSSQVEEPTVVCNICGEPSPISRTYKGFRGGYECFNCEILDD